MKDEESIELATSLTSESPLTQSAIESQPKSSSCLIDRAVEGEMRVRSGEQSPVISVVRRTSTAMELQQVSGQLKELVNQQEATYVMNGPKQTKQKQQQTQIQVRSSTVEHLIKLIMFLVTLTCLHLPVQQVDSQRLFRHHNQNQPDQQLANNPFVASDRLVLGQHQAFDQLLRSGNSNLNSNYNNNNFHFNSRSPNNQYHEQILTASQMLANQQRPAERRASAGPVGQVPPPGNQASPSSSPQQQKENGKLLVCYYTTRQSAPYWPKDAREYVIPADNINSITGTVDLSQATFAPILQYEPFKSGRTGGGSVSSDGFAQQQQALDFGFDPNFQMKNQQQQLVFKSASMQLPQLMGGQHLFDSLSGTRSAYLNVSSNSNNIANNNGNVGNSAKQHQDAISQMLELQQQQQQQLNPAHQQTLVIAGSATGDNPATNKNKQTPAYSFIGDLDANNGLIVGGGSGTIAPTISTLLQQPNSGANNLLINKDKSGASSQLDRNSMKQQLLFSPSLSRAFIVGNSGPNLNNEVLDTKSQLFIHPQQVAQANSNNNQYHPQTGAASMAYQHDKGKSAKVSGGEQVSGGVGAYQFSGSVSSTPPVPLSSASSVAMQSVAVPTYRSPLQHFSAANQLVISNNGQHGNSPKSPSAATPSSGSNSAALKLPYVDGSATKTASVPVSSSSSSSAAQSALPNAGSSTATNGINSSSSQQQSASLSSALVSSPLSTMFDVFGAASQYLMRFKPSSLMSPGTLSFNTLSADHHHHQHANNQQVATKLANSSLLSSLSSGSSSGSLIPLPFASSLVSSIHKSSSTSNERAGSSSSSSGVGSGILSRFSLQSAQRREDVCGRTIQTPERRIIGGEGAKYGEFPYQVHIKIAKHQCGGALVDKQSIVTAAHCVYHFITRAPVSKLQIVIGAYDIEDEQYQELPPQYFKVNKVKLHPNFRFSASHPDRYDIAILKLDKPVKYTDNVLPVCLPSKDLKFESAVGTVTGFGKTDPSLSNRYGTRLLQKVDVPIIENNECERWHRTRGIDLKIFPEMMCAGYEDGLKDACVGDSGGPLVVKTAAGPDGSFRWTLAGITSAGFGCAQSRQPGIYHRVSHTVDWILENLD